VSEQRLNPRSEKERGARQDRGRGPIARARVMERKKKGKTNRKPTPDPGTLEGPLRALSSNRASLETGSSIPVFDFFVVSYSARTFFFSFFSAFFFFFSIIFFFLFYLLMLARVFEKSVKL